MKRSNPKTPPSARPPVTAQATPTKQPSAPTPPSVAPIPARPAQGVTLRPGLRVQLMRVRAQRVDLLTINIPFAGTYEIETDGPLDTKCYLDDSQGGVLFVNDDGGDAANCRLKMRLPFGTYQLRILARPAGRYEPYGVTLRLTR